MQIKLCEVVALTVLNNPGFQVPNSFLKPTLDHLALAQTFGFRGISQTSHPLAIKRCLPAIPHRCDMWKGATLPLLSTHFVTLNRQSNHRRTKGMTEPTPQTSDRTVIWQGWRGLIFGGYRYSLCKDSRVSVSGFLNKNTTRIVLRYASLLHGKHI